MWRHKNIPVFSVDRHIWLKPDLLKNIHFEGLRGSNEEEHLFYDGHSFSLAAF